MTGKKRVTIHDVAREANTAVSTVSKAFNSKSHISDSTRQTILEIARKLGYSPSRTASSISRKPIHIVVLLPEKMNSYMEEALRGIEHASIAFRDYKLSTKVHLVPERRSEVYFDILKDYIAQEYDGAIVFPPMDMVHAEQLRENAGIPKEFPITTVTTDIEQSARLFCSQCDAVTSGRMAAEFLGLSIPKGGTVAFVTGSINVHAQRMNLEGFLSEIKKYDLSCVGTYEHMNIPDISREVACQLIANHPDIDGIYISTAVSTAFIEQLRELQALSRIKIVASDLSPQIIDYVRAGDIIASIFQNPYKQGRMALEYIYEYLANYGNVSFQRMNIIPQPILNSNSEYYERLYKERL